jgi:hypothetical protein
MLKCFSFIVLAFSTTLGCQSMSEKNPLFGSWVHDDERTVGELKLQNPRFQKEYKLVKRTLRWGEETRSVRIIVEHTENESISNLFDSNGIRVRIHPLSANHLSLQLPPIPLYHYPLCKPLGQYQKNSAK